MSRPIIPILFVYLLGILAGHYLPIPGHIYIISIISLTSLLALLFLSGRWRWLFLILSIAALALIGAARMSSILNPLLPPDHIYNLAGREAMSLEGVVAEPPQRRPERTRFYVELYSWHREEGLVPVTGRLLLTVASPVSLEYGDRIRFIAWVKRPRNFQNSGGFDYERFLTREGVFATAFMKNGDGIVRLSRETGYVRGWVEDVRERIRNKVYEAINERSAPVLLALITGDQGGIPDDIRDSFSRAGTAHVLAISGEHIGMIVIFSFALFLWILKRSEEVMLRINIDKAAALLSIPAVAVYAMIAGGGFSIVRAAVMGGAVLAAIIIDRRKDVPNLIALAAFLILVFEPQALFDISFQLSFASVISISLLVFRVRSIFRTEGDPRLHEDTFSKKGIKWAGVVMMITAAASLGTAPLVAYYFNRLSFISPVANLITVPLAGLVVVPLGLLSSLLIPLSDWLSTLLLRLDGQFVSVMVYINDMLASIPLSSIRTFTPDFLEISLFYISVILVAIPRLKMPRKYLLIAPLLLLALEAFYAVSPTMKKDLSITFLDVGQSESALVRFPGGKTMLIDGGGLFGDFDLGEKVVAPYLWRNRITSLDYVVMSHPDSDHSGGLPFILKNFPVDEFWEGSVSEGESGNPDIKRAIRETAVRTVPVSEGKSLSIGGAEIRVLDPPKGWSSTGEMGTNNSSVVLWIGYGRESFLFTGDIEREAETRLATMGDLIESGVLKVPHHGSSTSSTEGFLKVVRPKLAVFSVGYENRFGFPRKEVLERYKGLGIRTLRTDRDGAIEISTDGQGLDVKRYGH